LIEPFVPEIAKLHEFLGIGVRHADSGDLLSGPVRETARTREGKQRILIKSDPRILNRDAGIEWRTSLPHPENDRCRQILVFVIQRAE